MKTFDEAIRLAKELQPESQVMCFDSHHQLSLADAVEQVVIKCTVH